MMLRRHHAIVLISSLATIPVFATGCSEDEPAVPQVIFQGRLERGAATNCEDSTDLFVVGEFGNQNADPKVPSRAVADGTTEGQGNAAVTCAVTPAGPDEFDVAAQVNLSGALGGVFSVKGKFKTGGTQAGISALFSSRRTGNSYRQDDGGCTVVYATEFQGVAAGRVWGEITCPNAVNPSGVDRSCQAKASFRFENCAQ